MNSINFAISQVEQNCLDSYYSRRCCIVAKASNAYAIAKTVTETSFRLLTVKCEGDPAMSEKTRFVEQFLNSPTLHFKLVRKIV